MGIKTFEDLQIYQKGYKLALQIHQLTQTFPREERYELGSQLRRAALSIPLNIAEGYARTEMDFKRFLGYALGSANEVIVMLKMSKDLGYIKDEELINQYDILGKQIFKLRETWK